MSNMEEELDLSKIDTRKAMIEFLEGYALERKEELDQRKVRRGLLKSYLLETLDSPVPAEKRLANALQSVRVKAEPMEDGLYRVVDLGSQKYVGFLETVGERFIIFYTMERSESADRWVRNVVLSSPQLDHVWLSGWTFNVLWQRLKEISHPSRFVRIVFEHESIFQVDSDLDSDFDEGESEEKEETVVVVERRTSRFSLVDRIGVVADKLGKFQELYSPLYSITRLRFPSPVGRGGHEFFYNGKVTNRSDSFRDHRSHLLYVLDVYNRLTRRVEDIAWYSVEKIPLQRGGEFQKLIGAPLTVIFRDPLDQETFDHFISSTFQRVRNRFRLWGNPIRLGPRKVHVYGLDQHLWQPIFVEVTDKHLMAIVPKGTCGNTIHRLVTNIQRYLDPAARVTLGSQPYENLVEESSKGSPNVEH